MSKRPALDAAEEKWVADEDHFALQQDKKRAAIRVKNGRAQPIDWFAVTLAVIDKDHNPLDDEVDVDEIDLKEPESVFDALDDKALGELEKKIDSYLVLESGRSNREYWTTLKTICQDRRMQSESQPSARGVSSVAGNIDKLLGPKSLEELDKLERQIKAKLASNEPIDTDYWEHLLKSLLTYKAKANLRHISARIVGSRLEALRKQHAEDADRWQERTSDDLSTKAETAKTNLDPDPMLRLRPEDKFLNSLTEDEFAQRIASERDKVRKQGYIPALKRLADSHSLEPSSKRQRTENDGVAPSSHQTAQQSAFDREVARGLAENEQIFSAEEPVITKNLDKWKDQHRPRKPRYFNRVVNGYEWNKYNQTHYDHDNPPPKVVQGYRFNIFYPDLADKTKAPTYKIEREGGRRRGEMTAPAGEDDTCVIRFVAGAPYEDIAFRIVDKEWDYSAKRERGFISRFDKGVLQLWFRFKRVYYRK
ncbi:cactin [Teratosphaeria destructans]|uniref:Splicing factor Cactin n=1 Tax=Teratosphaeria destructans TaxID=418781 RepID=A0A9W7W4R8_9PEZI|nr:cactin [Teratosphaeria destructans]